MQQLLSGGAGTFGSSGPFRLRQQAVGRITEGELRRDRQHTVGGDGESGGRLDRRVRSHLGLADAQQGLLISEVNLYIPALEVSFDDLARVQVLVGANQECGLAIE